MTFVKAFLIVVTCLIAVTATAAPQVNLQPLDSVVKSQVSDVRSPDKLVLPIITWGGDIATIFANGNAELTTPGSIFGKAGLKFKLARVDDFKKQVEMYMAGETPYLRGTMGMINMASEILSKDPRTKPIVVYQLTWSAGGDCLVVKEGINSVKDLKGKTIAVQIYGPHIDYLGTVLRDAGLSMNDVKIKWTKDITGTEASPGEVFKDKDVQAAFCIIPDGLVLTSKGTVGTGSEGSVKGAKILMTTKTANRVIADVYAVRSDYFQANKKKVQEFVHSLMLAEQETTKIFKDKKGRLDDYKKTVTSSAQILMDSAQAVGDTESLFGDCEYVGFPGNVKFFTDTKWPRNFTSLSEDTQSVLISLGFLGRKIVVDQAKWNYGEMKSGITGTELVELPKFQAEEVAKVIEKKRATGTLQDGELFSFEIYFQPNQNSFSADMYTDAFNKAIDLASTYGGAVIVIEGHSDPLGYLKKKKEAGASEVILKRTVQAAKNLSLSRSVGVRDSVIEYAKSKGINLDTSQFTAVGYGIDQPKTGICGGDPCAPKTKDEWLSNMRVGFKIFQVEAEESAFSPMK